MSKSPFDFIINHGLDYLNRLLDYQDTLLSSTSLIIESLCYAYNINNLINYPKGIRLQLIQNYCIIITYLFYFLTTFIDENVYSMKRLIVGV